MTWRILEGDARSVLATLPAGSVHCVVTSPPYFGLRDYGVPGQLGLEATPEEYVSRIVEVFRKVRRVLRKDGTVFLNLGDSYAGSWGAQSRPNGNDIGSTSTGGSMLSARQIEAHPKGQTHTGSLKKTPGLKPKDLVGIPWRVAFALQADGWYLRSDIIWSKPNPMPESVTDRPTKAHEYVFLLTRSARYFYDADAVRMRDVGQDHHRGLIEPVYGHVPGRGPHVGLRTVQGRNGQGANLRSVWNIPTEPFPSAHFATFPKKLVEPCIKAGTSEKGCCPECGAPWVREVVAEGGTIGNSWHQHEADNVKGQRSPNTLRNSQDGSYRRRDLGWRSSCAHEAEPIPCTVLDPFVGSGTTGVVALRLGCSFIGIELSPEYVEMARGRLIDDAPLFNVDAEA